MYGRNAPDGNDVPLRDMNFTEQSQKVQQEYLQVYERRKARLQEQIDALQAKAESEELAVSMQELRTSSLRSFLTCCRTRRPTQSRRRSRYYSAGSRYRTRHPNAGGDENGGIVTT